MIGDSCSLFIKVNYLLISKVKYKCYFQSLNHFKNQKEFYTLIEKTNSEYKEYLHKLKFPEGIIKAIPFMRAGEKSRIILRPKYGCKY